VLTLLEAKGYHPQSAEYSKCAKMIGSCPQGWMALASLAGFIRLADVVIALQGAIVEENDGRLLPSLRRENS
jgi:hypothetical protein